MEAHIACTTKCDKEDKSVVETALGSTGTTDTVRNKMDTTPS